MTERPGLPADRPLVLDDRVRVWADASVVLGGAPWGVLRIAPAGRDFIRRLAGAGAAGAVPGAGVDVAMASLLLARGIAHPVPAEPAHDVPVDVVVPAYGRPELLRNCLAALRVASPSARIIVVDDGSPTGEIAAVAHDAGAELVRHPYNRGPAAARNTGLHAATSPIVAFVDADCVVTREWLQPLVAHFDDPRVAAAAPRIHSRSASAGLLARYQAEHSALDMGPRPELVTFGAPLGYLPSAAVLLRRTAVGDAGFDEDLRVGEDVDLIWRLTDDGWLVRYEPTSTVTHEARSTGRGWARQVFGYGTSAAVLDRRHPQRLTPARFSGWNIAIVAAVLARRPSAAVRMVALAGITALASALAAQMMRSASIDPRVAPLVVGKKFASDTYAAGRLLRREWWPVGWLGLGYALRSRAAAFAAATMLTPVVREWLSQRHRLDLPRFVLLRLFDDAAYGTGVMVSAFTGRRAGVLLPQVRLPYLPRSRKDTDD